ncbi:tRNA (adenosine(37)-N6)-dimethylallyltransferase MiaA [Acidiphilium acidophilum]|uniref:tRNA (adenosine(37)-N6)-dimethylallyltransferase MiaA n=1 Tax=Acidiphilium acidophilum TaxID=76588 RepID=UPI002E8E737B|nr:tRNA (adenosine(37)-N6)-dimethylallyltransferase MiaA [Acidiphilium acidophilum]
MDRPPKAITPPPARPLLIVAGPTASGKSALALTLATRLGGTIINADAMQCYAEWRIITARPSPADEAAAPHRLYGVRTLEQPVDAAWWRTAAIAELQAATLPILCGGTGMYLSSLIHGIAAIPAIPPEARAEARARLAAEGPDRLHAWLTENDPATALKLRPTDSQRLARAAEILLATGHGLAYFHARPRETLTTHRPCLILLDPPREDLRTAIATRFHAMLDAGALDEIRRIEATTPDPALPGLRAHGVPELRAHLAGTITLEAAAAAAIAATIAYTKRQATWFRHQRLTNPADTQMIHARFSHATQFSESINNKIMSFINNKG